MSFLVYVLYFSIIDLFYIGTLTQLGWLSKQKASVVKSKIKRWKINAKPILIPWLPTTASRMINELRLIGGSREGTRWMEMWLTFAGYMLLPWCSTKSQGRSWIQNFYVLSLSYSYISICLYACLECTYKLCILNTSTCKVGIWNSP